MFTAAVLDHTLNPRNTGPLENATHYGQSGDPGGGPYVLMWFRVEGALPLEDEFDPPLTSPGARIEDAAYKTYGCPAAVACASLAAELVKGKAVKQALNIDSQDLVVLLGGLPDGKGHCPALVVKALKAAFPIELS